MFKIEKDVPLPTNPTYGGCRPYRYPTQHMEVNDSFFVPAATVEARNKCRNAVYNSMRTAERKFPGRKYILASSDNGIRVWRVA